MAFRPRLETFAGNTCLLVTCRAGQAGLAGWRAPEAVRCGRSRPARPPRRPANAAMPKQDTAPVNDRVFGGDRYNEPVRSSCSPRPAGFHCYLEGLDAVSVGGSHCCGEATVNSTSASGSDTDVDPLGSPSRYCRFGAVTGSLRRRRGSYWPTGAARQRSNRKTPLRPHVAVAVVVQTATFRLNGIAIRRRSRVSLLFRLGRGDVSRTPGHPAR